MTAADSTSAAAARRLVADLALADPAGGLPPAQARAHAERARDLAASLGDADARRRACAWLCTHLYRLGLYHEVVREAVQALPLMAGAALAAERCELTRVLVIAASDLGEFGVALQAAEKLAASTAQEGGDDGLALNAAFTMAVCLERMGDSWQAIRVLTQALAQTEATAAGLPRVMALSMLGAIHIGAYHRLAGLGPDMGADDMLHNGRQAVSQARALLADVANPVYELTVRANLGEVLLYQGESEQALALLQGAQVEARRMGLLAHRWRIDASMGAWLLSTGQPAQALANMQSLIAEMGETAPQSCAIRAHDVAYKACRLLLQPAQALAHFEVVERLQRRSAVMQLRAQSQLFVTRVEAQQAQWQAQQARQDAQAQRERATELAARAERDPLTGLGNRRHFDRRCAELLPALQREGRPVALALLDIDHFKAVNDVHGHAEGDRVLVTLAQLLRENTRARDVLVRHGGEEFVIVLPGMTLEHAGEVCERLRACIAAHDGFGSVELPLNLTISMGLAAAPPYDAATLLHGADMALYRAKREGRDRVCTQAPPAPQTRH